MGRADLGLLKELVSKVPWESAFEGTGVHDQWSLFKSYLLRAQRQAIPKCWKSSKQGRRPAWLSRDLLELMWKMKMYGHWKQGQATREDSRDAVCHCREKIHAARARREFKLASTVKDNKNMLTTKGGSEITLVHYLMRSVTSQIGM